MKRTPLHRRTPLPRTRMRRKPSRDREEWVAARDAKLAAHVTCEILGCTLVATVVHHIRNGAMGKRDHRPENLQALCASHHRIAHEHPAEWRERYA